MPISEVGYVLGSWGRSRALQKCRTRWASDGWPSDALCPSSSPFLGINSHFNVNYWSMCNATSRSCSSHVRSSSSRNAIVIITLITICQTNVRASEIYHMARGIEATNQVLAFGKTQGCVPWRKSQQLCGTLCTHSDGLFLYRYAVTDLVIGRGYEIRVSYPATVSHCHMKLQVKLWTSVPRMCVHSDIGDGTNSRFQQRFTLNSLILMTMSSPNIQQTCARGTCLM